ncbi:E3 ubiquitin-protein ligase rnf220-like isoform x2 [Plakobranchus ocellatus]|uniref:E3 ubiquitin-protein ligase rnf220-like isoform x2 n=1 Tax=Plakobranchus ocellatus TaxID=259542 RepID=A0AAV3ZTR9_9GAST|nr:E3 ubiquitin-protein ligase rnf220-like isoform x2 [Plakobranchus ocellatus]
MLNFYLVLDKFSRRRKKQRKRASHDGQTPCCPVCGLTLRTGELEAHLMLEIDKLDRLSRGGRKSRDSTPQGRKSLPSPCGSRKGKDSPPPEIASRSRYDTFLRIRCNRQSRLTARRGQKKRRPGEEGIKETLCPICNERLTGATEELNAHVELCLKQQRNGVEEEEPVDVEGEFEEYEWAGQTRVRATSMLEGGFAGSGFQMSKKGSDDDTELNVDGDDTEEYGKPQFSDRDMVPLEEIGEGPGTSGTSLTFQPESSFASRTDTVNSEGAGCSSSSTAFETFDPSNCDKGYDLFD